MTTQILVLRVKDLEADPEAVKADRALLVLLLGRLVLPQALVDVARLVELQILRVVKEPRARAALLAPL